MASEQRRARARARYHANPHKQRERTKAYVQNNPRARLNTVLKHQYGITLEDYEALLEAQGGGCAICGQPCASGKRLAVDHCHTTGRVRGLLCEAHNKGIGLFTDSPRLLRNAAEYLECPSLHGQVGLASSVPTVGGEPPPSAPPAGTPTAN